MRFILAGFTVCAWVCFAVDEVKPLSCPQIVVAYEFTPVYPARSPVIKNTVRVDLPQLFNHGGLERQSMNTPDIVKSQFALKLIASLERVIKACDRGEKYEPFPWWSQRNPDLIESTDASGLPRLTGHRYELPTSQVAPIEQLDVLPRVQVDIAPRTPTRNLQLAELLLQEMNAFKAYASHNVSIASDSKLMGLIGLGVKLSENMKTWNPYSRIRGGLESLVLSMSAPSMPKGLSVTAGGAQDAGHFRKIIEQGGVPELNDFSADGLLRELDLAIPFASNELIAVRPSYLVDDKEKIIYVQLDTSSVVNPRTFAPNPRNVVLALDLSGSMMATDGTAHERVEWAKASLKTLLRKLNDNDTLSIIVFNDQATVFLAPTEFSKIDRKALEDRIQNEIRAGGGTDVQKAMALALELARQQKEMKVASRSSAEVESRIVLFSDVGHNSYGNREQITATVYEAANEGIGTTAVGLGENFEQSLVESFTSAKGNNYLFVQNGEQMQGLFDRFQFLAQPVAEDFKVSLELSGLPDGSKIERAWGLNVPADRKLNLSLPPVPTLFFAGEGGGGAMILAIRYATPDDGPAMPVAHLNPAEGPADDAKGPALPE